MKCIRDKKKLRKRYLRILKLRIYIMIRYRFLKNVKIKNLFRKDLFTNFFFFSKFYEDNLIMEKNIVQKNNSWTYYNYYFLHPFFLFEKQFLFNRLDFELFVSNNNLNLLFFKNKFLPGLNFWIKEINFDSNILIPKSEEDEKLFFATYNYSLLKEIDLYKRLYNFNFFLYCVNIISIYQFLIFLFYNTITNNNNIKI